MDDKVAIDALSALAQDTRLTVFRMLVKAGPDGMNATAIAEAVGVPTNTLSTHLGILSRAGLVQSRRESRLIIYTADFGGTRRLLTYLVQDCCGGHPEICNPLSELMTCC